MYNFITNIHKHAKIYKKDNTKVTSVQQKIEILLNIKRYADTRWKQTGFFGLFFVTEVTGKELCKSGVAVGESHMHIFGDKHTPTHTCVRAHTHMYFEQEMTLTHSMHECYKLSHTSCTTILSHRTKALSAHSQCLSTSEALFTLTTLQSERGSWKLVRVSWVLTLSPHLNRQPVLVTHYSSRSVKACTKCVSFSVTRNSRHLSIKTR